MPASARSLCGSPLTFLKMEAVCCPELSGFLRTTLRYIHEDSNLYRFYVYRHHPTSEYNVENGTSVQFVTRTFCHRFRTWSIQNDANELALVTAAAGIQHFACKRSYNQRGFLEVKVKI
jgi:hypothetical protein